MYLLFAVALLAVFYGGICLGIANCKRRFYIPKGATGVDKDGNFINS